MTAVLALLAILVLGPVAPAPASTPGVVNPAVTSAAICTTRWGKDARHVSEAMKQEVARRYGVRYPAPVRGRLTAAARAQRAKWEIDHLIPRELGGADVVDNLWPQPIADAHLKDRRENALHVAFCRGAVSLEAARAELRAWGKDRRR